MRDFDEIEFSRYDDEEETRRQMEELERREEGERRARKQRFQAMLDEERKRRDEDDEEQRGASDCTGSPLDPEERERIRRSNARFIKGLWWTLGATLASAVLGLAAIQLRDRNRYR